MSIEADVFADFLKSSQSNGASSGNDAITFDDDLSLGSFEGLSAELEAVEASDTLKRRKLNAGGSGYESSCSAFEKIMSCSRGGSPPRRASTGSTVSRNKLDLRNCTCLPGFFDAATKDKTSFDQILGPQRSLPAAPQRPSAESRTKQLENRPNALKGWLDDVLGSPAHEQTSACNDTIENNNDVKDDEEEDEDLMSCCPKPPPKQLRKPAAALNKGLSSEEKAELVKKRNREHAQATRRRQKMYIEYLKSQVEELSNQRQYQGQNSHSSQYGRTVITPSSLQRASSRETVHEDDSIVQKGSSKLGTGRRSTDECIDIEIRHKAAAHKFLELRTNEVNDPAHWGDVLAESCTVTMPNEPFRLLSGEVTNNRHTLKGIKGVIADNKSMMAFIDSLNRPDCPRVSMTYRAEDSNMMLAGDKLMCHWRLTTSGLRDRGLPKEVAVEGVMQASFNARCRLESVEFIYDVNALLQGFNELKLLDDDKQRSTSPAPSDMTQATVAVPIARPVPISDEDVEDAASRAPTPLAPRKTQVRAESSKSLNINISGGGAVIETRAMVPMTAGPTAPPLANKVPITSYPNMAALSQQAALAMGFGQMAYAPAPITQHQAVGYPGLVQQPRPQFMMVPVMSNGMLQSMPMMMPISPGMIPMQMIPQGQNPGMMPTDQHANQRYQ